MAAKSKECRSCREQIHRKASICPHCRTRQGWTLGAKLGMGFLLLMAFSTCLGRVAREGAQATSQPRPNAATGKPTTAQRTVAQTSVKPPAPKPEPPKKTAAEVEAEARVAKFGAPPTASAWDGHYIEVETYLEGIARDPDSVEFDGCTKVYHTPDGWLVGCNWRARNGFGGMNRQANWFTVRNERVVAMHDYSAFKE